MRIDSYDVNLLTGGDRFPVDDRPLPVDPVVYGDVDFSVLVHEDLVDFGYARALDEAGGMPPVFGTDGIEVPPVPGFEPGQDGEAVRVEGLAPTGFQSDDLEIAGGPTPIRPFTLGGTDTDTVTRGAAFAPFLDPLAFLAADGMDPWAALANPQAPPPIGGDSVQLDEPDWVARTPLTGQDELVLAPGPLPPAQYLNAWDGIELPRRSPLALRS